MDYTSNQQVDQFHTQIKEFIGVYRQVAATYSISENEFWVWQSLIMEEDEQTQQKLCSTWSLPKQTVNSIIAHMILKKYVRLEKKPREKTKVIRLTDEGRKYGQAMIGPIIQAENRAFAEISSEDFAQMIHVMQRYTELVGNELAKEI